MSASTQALLTAIRTRLLTFVPISGATLTSRLGGRLYVVQAPATVTYPYGIVRLVNRAQTDGFGGYRETGDVEVEILSKPRSEQWVVEGALDVCDQALLEWWAAPAGLQWARHRVRDTLPVPPDPMDRDVVIGRALYGYVAWLDYLLQYVS